MKSLSFVVLVITTTASFNLYTKEITAKPLVATEICFGSRHCVGKGLDLDRSEKFFGIRASRPAKIDEILRFDCMKVGKLYILATFSQQAQTSAQPIELDVSEHRQNGCTRFRAATRHLDAKLLPVSIEDTKLSVIEKFGPAVEVWQGPNPDFEIQPADHALIYKSMNSEQFVMIVISAGRIIRVLGSIAP